MPKPKKKTVKKAVPKKALRCAAKTKAGKRCSKPASGKSKFCFMHKRKK